MEQDDRGQNVMGWDKSEHGNRGQDKRGRMREDMRIRNTMEGAGWQGYAGSEQNGRGRAAK